MPHDCSAEPRVCGYTFDGESCPEQGDHFCAPRAGHAVAFCQEICVHTKDARWARTPFVLTDWQRADIVEPLFGQVRWDREWAAYVRQFRMGWIEVARKNGKSELMAFIALYLLVADGVEGAEIYGAAKDQKQASVVFDVAKRMVQLSPHLSKRLTIKDHIKRIIDEHTASYYEAISADASAHLGRNPSGVIFDEVLTQREARLWDALRTGMGTRMQPLMVAATTAGDDPVSFARLEHDECLRIQDEPERAPHRFVYIRNVPEDADPFDEANWPLANPALGQFLSIQSLREEAAEAANDPTKENAFRQFRCNQWVQQSHRWMPMHLYHRCAGTVAPAPDWLRAELLSGQGRPRAYAGLDLAAKYDLTAWSLLLPNGLDGNISMAWRFWLPEAGVKFLDRYTSGLASQWAEGGWITVTPGDVVDYDTIYADLERDCKDFNIVSCACDEFTAEPVRQELYRRTRLEMVAVRQNHRGMTYGMTELMKATKATEWAHHGNPVAEFMFDGVEVDHASGDADLIKPTKPDRDSTGKRIDGVVSAACAFTRFRELDAKFQRRRGMVVR